MYIYLKSTVSILLISVFLCTLNSAAAVTIYVKSGSAGDGTSWINAFGDLQSALDMAVSGDQIWVAEGTYTPTFDYGIGDGSNAYNHFRMINGVAIYGGFANTGDPVWSDRDPNTYQTVLSGDIGVVDDPNDNCFHVFFHPAETNLDTTAVLEGFTITGGNANDVSWPHDSGGGMYNEESSPTVSNCIFSDNSAYNWGGGMTNDYLCDPNVSNCDFTGNISYQGGGMYNYSSSPSVTNCTFENNIGEDSGTGGGMYNELSTPVITNSVFIYNTSDYGGGGLYNLESSPDVTNCTFIGNIAVDGGGLMNDYLSNPNVINCTFSGNTAVDYGGGMENYDNCLPIVVNCTFSGNIAGTGGGMDNYESDPTIINCIFWGNIADYYSPEINNEPGTPYIAYSDIQGGLPAGSTDGGGNISLDPLFVDADGLDDITGTEDDDLQLQDGSPCINAADNGAIPVGVTTDLNNAPRIIGGVVDMGAYENQTDTTSLVVTAPVLNEIWANELTYDIEWITANPSPNVKIVLFQGDSKVMVITNPTENDGSFSWQIPTTVTKGTDYRIKVICLSDTTVKGISDPFEIVGPCDLYTPIQVSQPNIASDWEMGQTYSVQWTGGEIDQNVKILLFKGPDRMQIITSSTPNDGEYDFSVPYDLLPGTDYRLKVKVLGSSCSSLKAFSDDFEISIPPVEVSVPDNSTTWTMGDTNVSINWSGFPPGDVKIKLFKGTEVKETISDSTENDGSYTWAQVPYNISPGSTYRVKISSTVNTQIKAFSDEFEIAIPPINVTNPTTLTEWRRGYTHSIQWTGGKPNKDVKIRLFKGGNKERVITTSTPNDGHFNWEVPVDLALGNDYSIEVIYLPDPSMRDIGDTFTVINSPVGTWKGDWIDAPDSDPLKLVINNNGTLTGKFTSGTKSIPFSGTYTYNYASGSFSSTDLSGSTWINGRKFRVTLSIAGNCVNHVMTGTFSCSIEKKKDGNWILHEELDGTFTVNRKIL